MVADGQGSSSLTFLLTDTIQVHSVMKTGQQVASKRSILISDNTASDPRCEKHKSQKVTFLSPVAIDAAKPEGLPPTAGRIHLHRPYKDKILPRYVQGTFSKEGPQFTDAKLEVITTLNAADVLH
jgi:hypothetical protein